jgi:hypothetical protein
VPTIELAARAKRIDIVSLSDANRLYKTAQRLAFSPIRPSLSIIFRSAIDFAPAERAQRFDLVTPSPIDGKK